MVKFYTLQIIMQNLSLEQVPEKWRSAVAEAINDAT